MLTDYIGFVDSVNRAFVSNGTAYDPPGTRWLNAANYNEYDFYVQDSWKVKPNFLVDFGVSVGDQEGSDGERPAVLVAESGLQSGIGSVEHLRWVEGELFKSEYGLWLPSVGFAWDPFKDGKTSIRANYRRASDRFATFPFWLRVFFREHPETTRRVRYCLWERRRTSGETTQRPWLP
jgi:outer membrane receptor protein involved in Fe transport